MIVAIAITVVTAIVATAAVPDRTNGDIRIAAVIAGSETVAITGVIETAARLDDRGRFRAVIRIAARAATNVAGIVIATRKRQGCRDSQEQGIRTAHRFSLKRRTARDELTLRRGD
jgi:hypothetical protein